MGFRGSIKILKDAAFNWEDEETEIDKDSAVMMNHFDYIEKKADHFKHETIDGIIDEATSCLTLDNNFIYIDR